MRRYIPVRTKGQLLELAADKERFVITLRGRTRRSIYKQFRPLRNGWYAIMKEPIFHPGLKYYVWQIFRKPEDEEPKDDYLSAAHLKD